MTQPGDESAVEPLKGQTREGKHYVRSEFVEKEIEAALDLPLRDTFRLAASGHLKPQTLVYFLRRFRPNCRNPDYDAMFAAFFARIERAGRRYLGGLPEHLHERAHGLVQDKVLDWFGDERMDIFELSFKTAVERLYLDARSKLMLRLRTERPTEDFARPEEDISGEEAVDALVFAGGARATQLAEARLELRLVLARLQDEERDALLYVDAFGLTEKEAAAQMGCSDRKVRYLLKRARATVHALKGTR